ncbi:hypothetical protein GBO17_00895 [Mycobacterium avium subsp. hominissuis]|nr:hypothetical protein [Mycobacterium avium subsp. hominissuis]MBZ4567054.1 hypothetical protein [Mycobacterium avium subsp. hominissuis]MBZ4585741.1 hypothetical protein [Mycobacterium avium subsp. hominissuis]MBZ4623212.1 hypothetical protein [Mycobacterium avium subsp. hominissuis]
MPTVTSAVALGVTHVLPASEALMQTSACWCVPSARHRIPGAAAGATLLVAFARCVPTSSATHAHATKPTSY